MTRLLKSLDLFLACVKLIKLSLGDQLQSAQLEYLFTDDGILEEVRLRDERVANLIH